MTPSQFALATGAPGKWIQNTRRVLGRPAVNDAHEARWLGLVHEFRVTIGVPLKVAAQCADTVVAAPPGQSHITIDFGDELRAALVIDLLRDRSIHLARLSRALEMPPGERRGRPLTRKRRAGPVERAIVYGIDMSLLESGLRLSVSERLQQLDDNTAFLREARRSSRKRR